MDHTQPRICGWLLGPMMIRWFELRSEHAALSDRCRAPPYHRRVALAGRDYITAQEVTMWAGESSRVKPSDFFTCTFECFPFGALHTAHVEELTLHSWPSARGNSTQRGDEPTLPTTLTTPRLFRGDLQSVSSVRGVLALLADRVVRR